MQKKPVFEAKAAIQLAEAISADLTLLAALQATELHAETIAELKSLGFPMGLGMRLRSAESLSILEHLKKVVAEWPVRADSGLINELAADFAAIYLNAQIGASPHESFWLDEDRLVMQKPMFQVRDQYRQHGMRVKNWRERADDHIVNELIFVAELVNAQAGLEDWPQAARFLDEHLLRWLGQFATRIASHSDSDFYSGLLLLTAAYCEELRDLMALVLDQPRPAAEEIEARMSDQEEPQAVQVAPPQMGTGPTW